jgi:hypothetical protein
MKTTFFGGGGRRVQAARQIPRRTEFVLNQGTEFLQAFRLRGALAGFGDDDVRQVGEVLIGLMAFDPLKDRQLALAVAAPADRRETARGQGLVQHLTIPQETVPPAVKGAVEAQGVVALDVRIDRIERTELVVRGPHPVEIGRREPQPAAFAHHPVRFAEKGEGVVDREMLQEVLGEDRLHVLEIEPLGDVGHHVHPRQRLDVHVHPAFEPGAAGADVELLSLGGEEGKRAHGQRFWGRYSDDVWGGSGAAGSLPRLRHLKTLEKTRVYR